MRCRKKLTLLLIVVVVMLIGLLGGSKILHIIRQSDFKVNNLRVDYQKNPIGIDVSDVKFSWQLKSKKNENQKFFDCVFGCILSYSWRTVVVTKYQMALGQGYYRG